MYRLRSASTATLAVAMFGLSAFAAACSSAPEEPILRQFFRASQLRDNATLANFAAASFDPRTDGVVSSFDITSVTEEVREPLKLRELREAVNKAQATSDEHAKAMKAYQDGNLRAIERVLKAESAAQDVPRADREVQTAWRQWRDESAANQKAVSEARVQLNMQLPVIQLSAQNVGDTPIDVTAVDGEMVSKDVTLTANVRMPDGTTGEQQLVVTLQRGVFNLPASPEPVTGRWVITNIEKG